MIHSPEVLNHTTMKGHELNERILQLLIVQEFGEISEGENDELLKLLQQDKANGGKFITLVNDREKLIDHIAEFTKDYKNEADLQRAKDEFFEMIKGKQSL